MTFYDIKAYRATVEGVYLLQKGDNKGKLGLSLRVTPDFELYRTRSGSTNDHVERCPFKCGLRQLCKMVAC